MQHIERGRYLRFARFFDRMADDLGNKLMALNSLWDTHYYAKSGFYTMLGAETAQGLPNAQLFYSFLRGAAKQFGTWIWGNASIYNRFGFKSCANQTVGGELMVVCNDAGTSLSLFRRLMYTYLLRAIVYITKSHNLPLILGLNYACIFPGVGTHKSCTVPRSLASKR